MTGLNGYFLNSLAIGLIEKLHQNVAGDIEKVIGEAVKKALVDNCMEIKVKKI